MSGIDAKYFDQNSWPGTVNTSYPFAWDGGDTAAIVGTIMALSKFRPEVERMWWPLGALMDLEHQAPLRHPDKSQWYGQPDRFSRDQLTPILCAFAMFNMASPTTENLFRWHAKKFFCLAWNTKGIGKIDMPDKYPDPCGPEIWALWIRTRRVWWLWPLLLIFDLHTLIGAIQWRWWPRNNITRNQMLVTITGNKVMWTPVMWLAKKITNWPALIQRWSVHCIAVGETPTAYLFVSASDAL